MITSNAKAEYGRSAGGQVELVTRSGTNSFSGTLYEFLRNTALDSNSYFNEQQGLPKEVLRRNQFGAALGGPIQRDRAFFFINYDGMRRTQETSQTHHGSDRAHCARGSFDSSRRPARARPPHATGRLA